jgi:hypothetical protein
MILLPVAAKSYIIFYLEKIFVNNFSLEIIEFSKMLQQILLFSLVACYEAVRVTSENSLELLSAYISNNYLQSKLFYMNK